MVVAAYVAQAPEFAIENGVACMQVISNGERIILHFPLFQFRIGYVRVGKLLAEYDAAGEVVQMGRH